MKTAGKRFLSLSLALILALLVLVGCGTSNDTQSSNASEADNTSTAADSAEEEVDDQLAAILKAGKIVIGIEGTYPPFTYHDTETDELTGFDVEIAKAIAAKLGVEIEFVEAAWDSLLAGIDSGRVDTVINAVSISDERKEKYDFAGPYLYITRDIWVLGDNDEIKDISDLNGKKIATNITNVYATWYQEQGAEIVAIDTSGEAMELLLSGRVDFIGSNAIVVNSYLEEHPEANVKCAFTIPDSDEPVGIPIRKGETRLQEAINNALDELSEEGTLTEISNKYFGKDYTKPSSAE
jgi:cystine transport system substrate-binding protein